MTKTRRLFGTDGIRGKANTDPMTAGTALRLGQAAGLIFTRGAHRHRVVIGKDTRLSGYMIEPALVAGFVGAGMDVTLVGPLPTPAIAMLTRSLRADLGVMISASHNPYEDNGIKLFGPDGAKLSDVMELEIEALMDGEFAHRLAGPAALGRAARLDDAGGRYIEAAKASFPRGRGLKDLKIVVDCAHGAVGAGRDGHPGRRLARWFQHQQRLRLHGARVSVRPGDGAWRRSGDRAGWRRGSGADCRRAW